MRTKLKILYIFIVFALILFAVVVPGTRGLINEWRTELKKVDDATVYETRKQVEDACRAMIASYKSDAMTYELYSDSENAEKQSWAEQARMRANKTAITYNEYILKNSFVWQGNIPDDICEELKTIQDN